MKIPETSANVGAYYGNEENGQWQPNGVIIDSGVGGGVVGSGDAGIHRPSVYPVHIPRGHIPGYVMAGAYYPAGAFPPPAPMPAPPDDFADYMWMENEEEFDKQVMQQLEEEALMEQCIEAMLEDEQRERRRPHKQYPTTSNGTSSLSLEETVSRSTLNPLAAEFVPTRARLPTEEKAESPSTPQPQPSQAPQVQQAPQPPQLPPEPQEVPQVPEVTAEPPTEHTEALVDSKAEEPPSPPSEPPEVSAADIERKPKDKKEAKKPAKLDTKKAKPQTVRSETKVQPKRKEVKSVKSEVKVDDREEAVVEVAKPQPSPAEEPAPSGPKPINYAAAARANKPKKPPTPPATEKPPPPKPEKNEKKSKPEKPVQRKNSTK